MKPGEQLPCQHTDCCKSQKGQCGGCYSAAPLPDFTEGETAFLRLLAQAPFLPVGRFLLKSGRSGQLASVALAPVFLTDGRDSMEIVRERGEVLKGLAEYGVITLDYHLPLKNYDYAVFTESDAYRAFQETVAEGRKQPGFLFDRGEIELGSLALTGFGQEALEG
jgi:hypothetical protein